MRPRANFCLDSFWGPRSETPIEIAERWLATVKRLQAIHPNMRDWYKGVDGRGVPIVLDLDAVARDIAESANDDNYRFCAKSDISGEGPKLFELDIKAGSTWFNVVNFGTDYWCVPDPAIVTYDIFKNALFAIADGFNVERSRAYPIKLQDLWPYPPNPNPPFPIAWISYCAPRIAHLVTPPSTALVERRPDGGLLMAATDETFDIGNPAHMSVARDIEAAVAPLNCTQPWEPEAPASASAS